MSKEHAEGLVILSGAAPSRQWRRPVQLMDVVRAAVAEVEDYARVDVRQMPDVHVTGAAVADLALSHQLPSVYLFRAFPVAGGLMSYGPDHHEILKLAAQYVDKILQGTNPGELPIQQPTKFDLVVNARTAKALGLTISPSILLGATEVIS